MYHAAVAYPGSGAGGRTIRIASSAGGGMATTTNKDMNDPITTSKAQSRTMMGGCSHIGNLSQYVKVYTSWSLHGFLAQPGRDWRQAWGHFCSMGRHGKLFGTSYRLSIDSNRPRADQMVDCT